MREEIRIFTHLAKVLAAVGYMTTAQSAAHFCVSDCLCDVVTPFLLLSFSGLGWEQLPAVASSGSSFPSVISLTLVGLLCSLQSHPLEHANCRLMGP